MEMGQTKNSAAESQFRDSAAEFTYTIATPGVIFGLSFCSRADRNPTQSQAPLLQQASFLLC